MAGLNNKTLLLVGAVLALIGWAVALGGVAKLTDMCNSARTFTKADCGRAFQYEWWGVWFTFILSIVIVLLAVMDKVDGWTSALQSFCAACLSVTMLDASTSISNEVGRVGDAESAYNASIAGFIIASVALFLLIIFLQLGQAGVSLNMTMTTTTTSKPTQGV